MGYADEPRTFAEALTRGFRRSRLRLVTNEERRPTLEAHPVAALFPMMSDEELAELAADIKERGQLQPIITHEGRILDGRNRWAACELAGVPAAAQPYDGDDPAGYALAVNVARRHLRPGQRYLVTEQARRLANGNGSGMKKSSFAASESEHTQLSQAATVLDWAPDLAAAVMDSSMSLATAVKEARVRKQAARQRDADLAQLREHAPDLAAMVDEGDLELPDAVAAMLNRRSEAERKEREEERQDAERRRDARSLLDRILTLTLPEGAVNGWVEAWAELVGADPDKAPRTAAAAAALAELAERITPP